MTNRQRETEGGMSDTPITDKVRAAIKESMTSRTQATYGTGYALRELDRLERELSAERAARERAERERDAAHHVESQIAVFPEFTGEPPYVGWAGLGLALREHVAKLKKERDDARAECERLGEIVSIFQPIAMIYAPALSHLLQNIGARGKKA
jgi:hypothetical protein